MQNLEWLIKPHRHWGCLRGGRPLQCSCLEARCIKLFACGNVRLDVKLVEQSNPVHRWLPAFKIPSCHMTSYLFPRVTSLMCTFSGNFGLYSLADPRGAPGTRAPPGGPNSFIFMQFSAKMWKIIAILGVGAPPPGENPGSATGIYDNLISRFRETGRLKVPRYSSGENNHVNSKTLLCTHMYVLVKKQTIHALDPKIFYSFSILLHTSMYICSCFVLRTLGSVDISSFVASSDRWVPWYNKVHSWQVRTPVIRYIHHIPPLLRCYNSKIDHGG